LLLLLLLLLLLVVEKQRQLKHSLQMADHVRLFVAPLQGNISAAQQDLSKLPAGGEDAAVESLRRQLEAAL
jgi:hypothetical protein